MNTIPLRLCFFPRTNAKNAHAHIWAYIRVTFLIPSRPPTCKSVHCFTLAGFCRLFGTKCAKCGQGFSKNDFVMRACAKVYHIDCFRCVACSRQLIPGDEFALREDGLFCKADHDVVDKLSVPSEDSKSTLDDSKDSIRLSNNNNNNNNDDTKHSKGKECYVSCLFVSQYIYVSALLLPFRDYTLQRTANEHQRVHCSGCESVRCSMQSPPDHSQ